MRTYRWWKDFDKTAILNLGITSKGQQSIFVMFPGIDRSMISLAEDDKIMKTWTDDIWNEALERDLPYYMRDERFGTRANFEGLKLNSNAARCEMGTLDYNKSLIERLNGKYLPKVWGHYHRDHHAGRRNGRVSKFRDPVLFAFSATQFPRGTPDVNGGWFRVEIPWPLTNKEEVLQEGLKELNESMNMTYVEKETIHIRGTPHYAVQK